MNSKIRISEIAKKISIGPFGSRMKSDSYTSTGVPVIRGTNLSGGKIFSGDWVFVSEHTADKLESCCVYSGDLVFPHRGSIGEVGIVTDQFPRYVMSSSLMKLTCDISIADPNFVYYFFKSKQGRDQLLKNTSQVGTPGIAQPLNSLKNIEIPLPSLTEQLKISKILGRLDDKIELNRQTNQTLEQIAQAMFKSWFVDFEPTRAKIAAIEAGATAKETERAAIRAISGKTDEELDQLSSEVLQQLKATAALFPDALVGSDLGEVPEGWDINPLSTYIDIKHGFAFKGEYFTDKPTGHILTTPGNFRIGGGIKTDKFKYYDGPITPEYIFSDNDLAITMTDLSKAADTLGYPALIPTSISQRYLHNQRIGKVEFIATRNIKNFLYQFFCSTRYRGEVLSGITGTTVKHTAPKKILSIEVAVNIDLAEKFSNVIEPILSRLAANGSENDYLAELRDTLLPKLLSGELSITPDLAEETCQTSAA